MAEFQMPSCWPSQVQRARRSARAPQFPDVRGRAMQKEVADEHVKIYDVNKEKLMYWKDHPKSAKRRLADKFADLEAEEEKALQGVQEEPQEEVDKAAFYGYENQTPAYVTGFGLYYPTPRVVVPLTKEEIDEDFRLITGRPPPRRGRRSKQNP